MATISPVIVLKNDKPEVKLIILKLYINVKSSHALLLILDNNHILIYY